MRRQLLLSALWLVALAVHAQSDPVVMTVNGVPVTRSEFEYSYNKNNGEGVIDKKTVEEYAELFVNYKLKVAAALDEHLDTLSSFKDEFAMYRDQQVRPTIVTDAEILDEARKAYNRAKESIGAKGLIRPAHIFFRLSTKATQHEQELVRQRADSVYRALQAGADFAALAAKVSQDPRSAAREGDLGWMQPGQTFVEFEEAAYALQPGQFSRPVLTPEGYHIILVKERKQLEPFEELKDMIVRSFEQQGLRDAIADMKVQQRIEQSGGTLTGQQVMQARADSLAAVDSEMKYLIQEYHDGLLLYEISNREVWERAEKDETGLRAWFDAHKKDYAWQEPHYKGIAYHVKTKADVKAVKRSIKKVPFEQWAEVLRTTFNADSVIRIRVEKGIFKAGDNGTIDRLVFKLKQTTFDAENADYPIEAVYGKKQKKYPDDYTDVRGQVVADYQQMLELEWVKSLRQRYPVQINQEILKTVNRH
ncbi:MAG: peptidylprolyl isomerase [Prevotella sp.]|nr:peptidylprolyl isomerase [Prevotella sp.]